jgi:hypothetical protein
MTSMRSRTLFATLFLLAGGAGLASAQTLSMEFHDGKVRIKANNVPVSRILAEWTRIGGTRIVHGERIPGAPLTLEIMDVPERQALDIVLRGAAGYMVLARDTTAAGASTFDKILVLPTTTRAPAAAALPPPPPQAPPTFQGENNTDDDDDNAAPFVPPPAGAFPRGRAPNVNRPQGAPVPTQPPVPTQQPAQRQPPQQQPPDVDEDAGERNEPAAPAPGNPFGVVPGGARPGTISPAPPQQPNTGQQPR